MGVKETEYVVLDHNGRFQVLVNDDSINNEVEKLKYIGTESNGKNLEEYIKCKSETSEQSYSGVGVGLWIRSVDP